METTDYLCSRCETPLEAGDLRCSICGQSAPFDAVPHVKTVVQILRCQGCGAAIGYDPKKQTPSCSFCDGDVKVETIEDPMEQTEAYLPFTVSADDARRALHVWLGSLGWFRPSDLRSAARLEELRPIWWVAWVFDAESDVSWAADSNADSRRSSWAPHSGQTHVRFDNILASASRGLTLSEVDEITPGMNLSSARPDPSGAENATMEQFDLQRSQARAMVSQTLTNLAASHVQNTQIPGTAFRNVKVSVIVRKLVTNRLSLPAYVMAYRYKNTLFRVVICGQDTRLLCGKAPYSFAKIFLVVVGVLAAGLIVLAMIAASQ